MGREAKRPRTARDVCGRRKLGLPAERSGYHELLLRPGPGGPRDNNRQRDLDAERYHGRMVLDPSVVAGRFLHHEPRLHPGDRAVCRYEQRHAGNDNAGVSSPFSVDQTQGPSTGISDGVNVWWNVTGPINLQKGTVVVTLGVPSSATQHRLRVGGRRPDRPQRPAGPVDPAGVEPDERQ